MCRFIVKNHQHRSQLLTIIALEKCLGSSSFTFYKTIKNFVFLSDLKKTFKQRFCFFSYTLLLDHTFLERIHYVLPLKYIEDLVY